jgi:hypothetical protein
LKGYFLAGLLVLIGGAAGICLNITMQQEGTRNNSATRNC